MTDSRKGIVLIGFMGAGKSSVGRALERRIGWPLYDTDKMVAQRFGSSIAEIFAAHGEAEFRLAETEALATPARSPAIIVTGGGIILREDNRRMLKDLGTVIYLATDEETLFERVSRRNTRPLLQTANPRATLAALLREREPLYRAAADLAVVTDGWESEEVADMVLRQLEAARHVV